MGAVVGTIKRVRACDKFVGYGKFCRACYWSRMFHAVPCAECGESFRSRGGLKFSSCAEHRRAA